MTIGDNVLRFAYDASGLARTVTWNGTVYYYATNLQGDIIAILDADGNAVAEYIYDAWGNIHSVSGWLADTLGYYNPLRYRGYVYDTETGLYYLQSRYYNPEIGRFINADAFVSTGIGIIGNNMYLYCNNNPIRFIDEAGYSLDDIKRIYSKWSAEGRIAKAPRLCEKISKQDSADKLKQVATSFWNNLEVSLGVGLGFYYEFDVLDAASLSIGLYSDNGTLKLQDGEFSYGQDFNVGASISLWGHNIGYNNYIYQQEGVQIINEENKWFYSDDTWTIYGISAYLGGGGTLRIGFDIVQFCNDMRCIF